MSVRGLAHGDGILVNFDSPEALEEVFWRVTCGESYIRPNRLIPMSIDVDAKTDFIQYVSLLLKQHTGKRYLSKGGLSPASEARDGPRPL